MTRPLMKHGVGQLQKLFFNSTADVNVLTQLENELQYRQVPKAVALLAEVRAAIHLSNPVATVGTVSTSTPGREPSLAAGSEQPDLWARLSALPVFAHPSLAVAPIVEPQKPPPLAAKPEISAPSMPLDDAYKLLEAMLGTSWECIEQRRRTLVQQSHPSRWKSLSTEDRIQALAEAKRVNAAYATVSQARCYRR